jgi:hypothetical protein
MKKLLLSAVLFLFAYTVFSQTEDTIPIKGTNGIECLIVEKVPVPQSGIDAGVPEGSIAYRIFVDMEEGYKCIGFSGNDIDIPLIINSTLPFFNDQNAGSFGTDNMVNFWGMVPSLEWDTYATDGRIGMSNYVGIPYRLDVNDGTVDGYVAITPETTPAIAPGVGFPHDILTDEDVTSFENLSGGWAMASVVGPTPENVALVGQFTTTGTFAFSTTIAVKNSEGTTFRTPAINYNMASSLATLDSILVDGEHILAFQPDDTVYRYPPLPRGTELPVVEGVATDDNADVVYHAGTEVPDTVVIEVIAEDGINTMNYYVIFTAQPNTDATLADLLIDGVSVEGFDSEIFYYYVVLDPGTIEVPVVTAVPSDTLFATVDITPADTVYLDSTSIKVTAENAGHLTYYIQFYVQSQDATLSDLQVDGLTVEGFDPEVLAYDLTIWEGTNEVSITASASHDSAEIIIILPVLDEGNGVGSVSVIAEDRVSSNTYTLTFTGAVPVEEITADKVTVFFIVSIDRDILL